MRGIFVAFIVLTSLPVILMLPHIGVFVWTWLAFMNPHRLSWGFARDFPFALVVAITTLVGMLLTGRWRRPPVTLETAILALFILWTIFTTVFAANQLEAWDELARFLKVQLMVYVTMMLICTPENLRRLVWIVVSSIGAFGVVGGIFTILNRGQYRVWGPDDTFIGGNNEIALALIVTIPMMRYLQLTTDRKSVSYGLLASMALSVFAILGTHSRGALVGIVAMLIFLIWKSRQRLGLVLLFCVTFPLSLSVMPQAWYDRMMTIRNYRQDESAMSRLNSWQFALNLAVDRPIMGAGFDCFTPELFSVYAPNPQDVHDSHSIYFEVLAEHGFVGLLLFLCLALSVWWSSSRLVRRARDDVQNGDMEHLGRMLQVAIIGYAVNGAFLGLAYFDLVYTLIAILVVAKTLIAETEIAATRGEQVRPAMRRLSIPRSSRLGSPS